MCRYSLGDELAYEATVIPAKAGIHPLTPLDAGVRRHDSGWGSGKTAISYTVDERKAHDHFVLRIEFVEETTDQWVKR
jgi:hypothetical protein